MGRIGRAVARRLEGFGAEVIHSGRSGGVPLDELLERSDFVTLHCPLTPDTRGLIDAGGARADEADRLPREHRARADRGHGRAHRRARAGRDRGRGARRDRPRAAARRPPAARRAEPARAARTSARPRTPPASGWPTWRWTTCWPAWRASACRTAPTRRSTRGSRGVASMPGPAACAPAVACRSAPMTTGVVRQSLPSPPRTTGAPRLRIAYAGRKGESGLPIPQLTPSTEGMAIAAARFIRGRRRRAFPDGSVSGPGR